MAGEEEGAIGGVQVAYMDYLVAGLLAASLVPAQISFVAM